jgi:hypothetical protein
MSSNSKTSKNSLWDNDMVNAAKKSMSKEELLRYEKIGESMFKDIDFETSAISNNKDPLLSDAVAYIIEGLKSGLHPSMLDSDELNVLENYYGKEWYESWGYKKEDLNEIVTIKKE